MSAKDRDPAKVYLTRTPPTDRYYHAPDGEGHEQFTLEWYGYNPSLDQDGWRAQVFYARIREYRASYGARLVDLDVPQSTYST